MEVLAMRKYGIFVWSCFALTFIVLIGNEWMARVRQKQVYKEVEVRLRAIEEKS